jgi:hypothetical protein
MEWKNTEKERKKNSTSIITAEWMKGKNDIIIKKILTYYNIKVL